MNTGLSPETFTIENLKIDQAAELMMYYQFVKDILEDAMKVTETLYRMNRNWREHAKVYTELSRVVSLIPYEILSELFEKLAPPLFMMLKEGMEEVKREGSLLLIHLIYYVPNSGKRKSSIDQIIQDFAKSNVSANRKTYIDFCVKAMQVTS